MFNIDVKKKGNKKNLYIITVYVFNNNFTLLYFTLHVITVIITVT